MFIRSFIIRITLILDTGGGHCLQDPALAQDEDEDGDGNNHNLRRGASAGTGNAAGQQLVQGVYQGFLGFGVDHGSRRGVPKALDTEDDHGQPCRFHVRHHDIPEDSECARAVNGSRLNQGSRQAFHELLHQEHTDRCRERRKDQGPVGVDHAQAAHDQVVRNAGHIAGEHQARGNHGEECPSARELVFCQHERRHTRDHQVSERTDKCDQDGIDQVAAEGNPALSHQDKQIGEVVRCRLGRPYGWREPEELIQRLEAVADQENQREYHQDREKNQNQVNPDIAADGPVWMPPGNQVLFWHLDLLTAQLRQTVELITSGPGHHRLICPVLIHMVIKLQTVVQVEDIPAVVLQDYGNLAGCAAPADPVHPVHPRVGPLHNRFGFSLRVESRAGFFRLEVSAVFLSVNQLQGAV